MGAGKSTIGRKLALRLGYRFYDTDNLIADEQAMSITELFKTKGESFFRELETQTLKMLKNKNNTVIATGGGILSTRGNLELMKSIGRVVFLNVDLEILFERVSRNKKRPLLQTENPRQRVTELLEKRLPQYQMADIVIMTGSLTKNQVVSKIIQAL